MVWTMTRRVTGLFTGLTRAARPERRPARARLGLEALEGIALPSATLGSIAGAFNAGNQVLVARANDLASAALGTDLPAVRETVASAARVGDVLRGAVDVRLAAQPATPDQLAAGLRQRGFTVEYASATQDGRGDYLRASKEVRVGNRSAAFTVGDAGGLDYFDRYVNGSLGGGATAAARDMVVRVTVGVDGLGGQPTFYLAEGGAVAIGRLAGTGRASGTVKVGGLSSVRVQADVGVDLSASLTFRDSDGDRKLRAGDLRSGRSVVGDIDGTIGLNNARFTARVANVADVSWGGRWAVTLTDSRARAAESLALPDYREVIRSTAVGFVAGRSQLDLFSGLSKVLDKQVPFTKKRVADFLPKDSALRLALFGADPGITRTMTYDQVVTRLKAGGIKVDVDPNLGSAMMARLVRGERVSLLSSHLEGSVGVPGMPKYSTDLAMYGIPWLANASVGVEVSTALKLVYTLDTGLDTLGFYVGANSHVGVRGEVYGGFYGKVQVVGLDLGKVSGGLTLAAEAGVRFKDPSPGDGRVYSWELSRLGQAGLGVDAKVTVEGSLKAKALFGLWSKSWSWPLATIVDYHS